MNVDTTSNAYRNNAREEAHFPPQFVRLMKLVTSARTAAQEHDTLAAEVANLRLEMAKPEVDSRSMTELLTRSLFCHTMDQEVSSFAAIKAVMLTQDAKTAFEKHIAYLCVSVFLHERHELNLLMVNTLQRDLAEGSSDFELSTALSTLCSIASPDMISPLLPLVIRCLRGHDSALVRKRSVFVLKRFAQLIPGCLNTNLKPLKRALADTDEGVMGATLALFTDLVKHDCEPFQTLLPAFVHIYGQLVSGRLSAEFDFHGVHAPWLQVRTLDIISILSSSDIESAKVVAFPLLKTACIHSYLNATASENEPAYALYLATVRGLHRISAFITADGISADLAKELIGPITKLLSSRNENLKHLGAESLKLLELLDATKAAELKGRSIVPVAVDGDHDTTPDMEMLQRPEASTDTAQLMS